MESGVANGYNDDYITNMHNRLVALEVRFDTLLPLLATKADLAELKAALSADIASVKIDVKTVEGSITKWVVTTFITLILGFTGLTLTMLDQMNTISERIELIAGAQPARGK